MVVEQVIHESDDELGNILRLRMAVGLLGEKDHGNWWPSLWFTPNAVAFLTPIYGARTDATRYQGVVEAARVVHDNRIGVGQAFHLFRLPEALERRLHDAVVRDDACSKIGSIPSKSEAEEMLSEISQPVEANEGPIRVGSATDLESSAWIKVLAGHYLSAFRSSQQVFPYFTVNA